MSIRKIFNKGYALLRRAKIGRQNFERGVSLDVDFDHVGRRQLLIIQPDAIHRSGSVFTNSRTTAVFAKSLPRFGIRNGGGDYADIILNRDIFAEKGRRSRLSAASHSLISSARKCPRMRTRL